MKSYTIFSCRTIVRFKKFVSELFLAQITTSGITICVTSYFLAYVSRNTFLVSNTSISRKMLLQSSSESLFEIPIFFVCLMYGIFDIFLVMYLGNEISVASARLAYCLFESAWIGQSKSCLKCLLLLDEIVRRPQQLVILKIYPINLETFTQVSTDWKANDLFYFWFIFNFSIITRYSVELTVCLIL